jgi:hypothetical protein
MKSTTLLLLALVAAAAFVAVEARSLNSKQQKCYGNLVASARNYNRDQSRRLKEIRLINEMISMVNKVRAVKGIETDDNEDLETEDDVEEDRAHRELHGRGGVMSLLNQLKARLHREGRIQNTNVHRRMRSCEKLCAHNSRVAASQYKRASSHMRRSRSLSNRALSRYHSSVAARRQKVGAHASATKGWYKNRNMINREINLINKLLAMVNRLHSVKSVQEILSQAKTSELEGMKPVINELQRVSPESRKVQRLLIALRNKLLRDKAAAWKRVVRAKKAISVARSNERRAYNKYRDARRRYKNAVSRRNSKRNALRRQKQSCAHQRRYIRKLRRI